MLHNQCFNTKIPYECMRESSQAFTIAMLSLTTSRIPSMLPYVYSRLPSHLNENAFVIRNVSLLDYSSVSFMLIFFRCEQLRINSHPHLTFLVCL